MYHSTRLFAIRVTGSTRWYLVSAEEALKATTKYGLAVGMRRIGSVTRVVELMPECAEALATEGHLHQHKVMKGVYVPTEVGEAYIEEAVNATVGTGMA